MRVDFAGESIDLLPERAAWWEREATLFVADIHFGKAAAFRSAGLPVPGGTTAADVARLDALVRRHRAARLVILGDLLHAPTGRAEATMQTVRAWRDDSGGLDVLLVRGNHDRRAGDPPADWRMACVDGPHPLGPFTLAHEPDAARPGDFLLAGHLHPGVALHRADGRSGGMRERCFWMTGAPHAAAGRTRRAGASLILPAFGAMTGLRAVRPRCGDRVFVVGPGEVVEVPGAAPVELDHPRSRSPARRRAPG